MQIASVYPSTRIPAGSDPYRDLIRAINLIKSVSWHRTTHIVIRPRRHQTFVYGAGAGRAVPFTVRIRLAGSLPGFRTDGAWTMMPSFTSWGGVNNLLNLVGFFPAENDMRIRHKPKRLELLQRDGRVHDRHSIEFLPVGPGGYRTESYFHAELDESINWSIRIPKKSIDRSLLRQALKNVQAEIGSIFHSKEYNAAKKELSDACGSDVREYLQGLEEIERAFGIDRQMCDIILWFTGNHGETFELVDQTSDKTVLAGWSEIAPINLEILDHNGYRLHWFTPIFLMDRWSITGVGPRDDTYSSYYSWAPLLLKIYDFITSDLIISSNEHDIKISFDFGPEGFCDIWHPITSRAQCPRTW